MEKKAYLVCAFSGGRARSSVLGVRPSASTGSRVSGAGYPEPGTQYLVPGGVPVSYFEKPAHGV